MKLQKELIQAENQLSAVDNHTFKTHKNFNLPIQLQS